jgi:hypothetical protein
MDLNLEWGKPLPLVMEATDLYWADAEKIPNAPGIYVFFREYGDSTEALYVGQARDLQSRIKQDLDRAKLMNGVKHALNGSRFIAIGELKRRPGQQVKPCLKIMEHALIRYYLARGDALLNIQGTRIRKHSLTSERKWALNLIPKDLYFE